jgi:hypothetical protein
LVEVASFVTATCTCPWNHGCDRSNGLACKPQLQVELVGMALGSLQVVFVPVALYIMTAGGQWGNLGSDLVRTNVVSLVNSNGNSSCLVLSCIFLKNDFNRI